MAHSASVEEYLHTSFEYDAEYVDGQVVYRPLPDRSHSEMQAFLIWSLYEHARPRAFHCWPSLRVRTQAEPPHYRVPDLCVTVGEPDEDIFTTPPFLCIEILTVEDSALELRVKGDEYLDFGVSYVWVIDPVTRAGEIHTPAGIEKVRDGKFKAGQIEVDLAEMQ